MEPNSKRKNLFIGQYFFFKKSASISNAHANRFFRATYQISHQCQLMLNNGMQKLAFTTNVLTTWNIDTYPNSLNSKVYFVILAF